MRVKECYGDLFEIARINEVDAIAHGCNVYGVMGAGIAKEFKRRFPNNYRLYKDICTKAMQSNIEIVGSFCGEYNLETNKSILNLFTQDKPGPYARLEWIKSAFEDALDENSIHIPRSIAIPKIGCGIGGLTWTDVKRILEEIESDTEIVVAYL